MNEPPGGWMATFRRDSRIFSYYMAPYYTSLLVLYLWYVCTFFCPVFLATCRRRDATLLESMHENTHYLWLSFALLVLPPFIVLSFAPLSERRGEFQNRHGIDRLLAFPLSPNAMDTHNVTRGWLRYVALTLYNLASVDFFLYLNVTPSLLAPITTRMSNVWRNFQNCAP